MKCFQLQAQSGCRPSWNADTGARAGRAALPTLKTCPRSESDALTVSQRRFFAMNLLPQ